MHPPGWAFGSDKHIAAPMLTGAFAQRGAAQAPPLCCKIWIGRRYPDRRAHAAGAGHRHHCTEMQGAVSCLQPGSRPQTKEPDTLLGRLRESRYPMALLPEGIRYSESRGRTPSWRLPGRSRAAPC